MTDNKLRDALKTAIEHIEHMSAWIALRNTGYSFESLGEDMPGIRGALSLAASFQDRVRPWMLECFGEMASGDREERNHRFLEEALELVQACGCTQSEAHQLVDYVYGRDQGDINQEVGGVMVTLAALCLANGIDMHAAGETELARIWTKVDQIRAKQAAKPKHSPLPGPSDAAGADRVLTVPYTNWRGETAVRRIVPKAIRFGSTEWHPEPQWLLLAWDADKQADREFALKDFGDRGAVQDQIIGQIEERFPDWRGFRDLIDCIDVTMHRLRSYAPTIAAQTGRKDG